MDVEQSEIESKKPFGMNWKMTAKTILVQMHHKIQTFEHLNKKLVLVVQDRLLNYMNREFNFGHLRSPASIGNSMHFHSYRMAESKQNGFSISMNSRFSTDADGIGECLGLQTEAKIELQQIIDLLESKISTHTLFSPV